MSDTGEMMLTIMLRHDQSKPLAKINQEREETGFWDGFPPDGVEVVSWYVMMGIGQVATLRLPADSRSRIAAGRRPTPGPLLAQGVTPTLARASNHAYRMTL